ncbi:unnamed protein product [Hermetia illucens]|uniref:HTH cro/C1-type domain-containing protein n=1 Tax=Hermetia illucens TaxID=343691 RepID=A0A7R8YTH9_HERIL|nr:endothelial differentiation-related factor 1 homolog isoform X1 [Hermetia illucens]CAD7081704.1 unnamed protein product [Hermetia illucens]
MKDHIWTVLESRIMSSDWDTVTVLRKRAPKAAALKSEGAINAARRQGIPVATEQKFGAGTNKQHVATKNTAKLDRETEELKHSKIPLDVGRLIQQGRQAKGLSQKDLATKICEKQQVVNDYEAGRGIPNNLILGKIERVIGVKLRGKDRGTAVAPPGAKK